jgi:hypothetical protein
MVPGALTRQEALLKLQANEAAGKLIIKDMEKMDPPAGPCYRVLDRFHAAVKAGGVLRRPNCSFELKYSDRAGYNAGSLEVFVRGTAAKTKGAQLAGSGLLRKMGATLEIDYCNAWIDLGHNPSPLLAGLGLIGGALQKHRALLPPGLEVLSLVLLKNPSSDRMAPALETHGYLHHSQANLTKLYGPTAPGMAEFYQRLEQDPVVPYASYLAPLHTSEGLEAFYASLRNGAGQWRKFSSRHVPGFALRGWESGLEICSTEGDGIKNVLGTLMVQASKIPHTLEIDWSAARRNHKNKSLSAPLSPLVVRRGIRILEGVLKQAAAQGAISGADTTTAVFLCPEQEASDLGALLRKGGYQRYDRLDLAALYPTGTDATGILATFQSYEADPRRPLAGYLRLIGRDERVERVVEGAEAPALSATGEGGGAAGEPALEPTVEAPGFDPNYPEPYQTNHFIRACNFMLEHRNEQKTRQIRAGQEPTNPDRAQYMPYLKEKMGTEIRAYLQEKVPDLEAHWGEGLTPYLRGAFPQLEAYLGQQGRTLESPEHAIDVILEALIEDSGCVFPGPG